MNDAEYRYVIIEVIDAPLEASRHRIRAKPLAGQGYDEDIRMECPTSIRHEENIDSLYKVWTKLKDTSQKPQLFTSYHWEPEPITRKAAKAFIKSLSTVSTNFKEMALDL